MRIFLGMVLGALLTIGAAFVIDSMDMSATTGASAGVEHRRMVNWDVVSDNWRTVRRRARATWTTLSHKVSG